MHYAAAADRMPWLKCLLNEGANIHEQDHAGNTPLHAAAHSGAPGAVRFLIQEKADLTKKNNRWALTERWWFQTAHLHSSLHASYKCTCHYVV